MGAGTLLISRDGDDDSSSVRINATQTNVTETEHKNKKNHPIQSISSVLSNSNSYKNQNLGCDIFVLLKLCWSWFCGLDDSHVVNDDEDSSVSTVSYQSPQRKTESGHMNRSAFILKDVKERPIINWILNGNLVILILVEIALFVVFSLPVKYTFWRD